MNTNQLLLSARGRYFTKYENILLQHNILTTNIFLNVSQEIAEKEKTLLRDANFSFLNLLQKSDPNLTENSGIYTNICKNNKTILRYAATCVREGFQAYLAKELLEHFIHDTKHFENQIHFLLESLQYNVSKESIRLIKPILESTLQYHHDSLVAREIQEKSNEIVMQTVENIFRMNSQLDSFYTEPHAKKDTKAILDVFCETLNHTNKEFQVEKISSFCAQHIFPNFDKLPGEILLVMMLSLHDAITANINLDICFSATEILDTLVDLIEEITVAGNLYKKCDSILLSSTQKTKYIQKMSPVTERRVITEIQLPVQKLIHGIAELISSGNGTNKERLAKLWSNDIIPFVPVQEMNFVGEALRSIAQSTQENVDAYTNEVFLEALLTITDIVRQMMTVSNISDSMGPVHKQAINLIHQNNPFAIETTIEFSVLLQRITHTILVFCSRDSLENSSSSYRSFIIDCLSEQSTISTDAIIDALKIIEHSAKEKLPTELFSILKNYITATKEIYQLKEKLDDFVEEMDKIVADITETLIKQKTIVKQQQEFIQNTLTIITKELVTLALKDTKGEALYRYFLHNILAMINIEPDLMFTIFFVMREKISIPELQLLIKNLQHEIPKLVAGVRIFKQSRQLAYDCSDKVFKKLPKQTIEKIGKLLLIKDLETILRNVGYVLTSQRVSSNTKQWFQDRERFQLHVITSEIFASIDKQVDQELRAWFSEIEANHIQNALNEMYS